MDRLPPEVVIHLCDFLSPVDVLSLALVNRQLSQVCLSDSVWRSSFGSQFGLDERFRDKLNKGEIKFLLQHAQYLGKPSSSAAVVLSCCVMSCELTREQAGISATCPGALESSTSTLTGSYAPRRSRLRPPAAGTSMIPPASRAAAPAAAARAWSKASQSRCLLSARTFLARGTRLCRLLRSRDLTSDSSSSSRIEVEEDQTMMAQQFHQAHDFSHLLRTFSQHSSNSVGQHVCHLTPA